MPSAGGAQPYSHVGSSVRSISASADMESIITPLCIVDDPRPAPASAAWLAAILTLKHKSYSVCHASSKRYRAQHFPYVESLQLPVSTGGGYPSLRDRLVDVVL